MTDQTPRPTHTPDLHGRDLHDQTPRTEAYRTLETYIIRSGTPALGPIWQDAMEALDTLAQARTEALDVDVLAEALPDYLLDTENGILHRDPIAQQIAARYRAILAGETE